MPFIQQHWGLSVQARDHLSWHRQLQEMPLPVCHRDGCGALYGYKVPALMSCGKPEKQLKTLWIWDNLGSLIAGFTTFVPLTYHVPSPLTSQISWRGCSSWRQRHFLNNEITETSPWSMVSRGNGPWMASFWVITIYTAQRCMDMIEYASLKRTLEFRHLRDVNLQ